MYLSRLTITTSRQALLWLSNPYRVHQRLMMACEDDPRLLFRVEGSDTSAQILAQTHLQPNWQAAFDDFPVLARQPEVKAFDLQLAASRRYRFRLQANPTVRRNGSRFGLLKEEEQQAWLERKLREGGALLLGCFSRPGGLQVSRKTGQDDRQVHWVVTFDGLLEVTNPECLSNMVQRGIGAAKGYGCGLLSLAPAR